MRRSLPTALVVVVGLLLLLDFVVVNPSLAALAGTVLEYVVLIAAAAAITGALALGLRQMAVLRHGGEARSGPLLVLGGMAAMLIAGFYPGSAGAADPAVRWLVAALLMPLVAALFALLFFFLLSAAQRALRLRSRETTVMLVAACAALVLLLPLGGVVGAWLAGASSWAFAVPIGGVFRGLLIGIAIATAVSAARILLAVDGARDE